jgi:hypothetical protein
MSELDILKKSKCPSLSGKSTLNYEIGVNENDDVFLRVAGNTGGGYFSAEWVSLEALEAAFTKRPDNISSIALFGLFKGKSVNTPSFVLAVARHEGIVKLRKGRQRKHELGDLEGFRERIRKLMPEGAKATTTRKSTVKKKATPRKRATR